MLIDCISDLHGFYPRLDGGDILIVAGDLTARDQPIEYGQFAAWLDRQKYRKKILIAGNHDTYFQKKGFESIRDVYSDIQVDYLCDSGTEFEGLKIWGSPWTKTFSGMNPRCKSFTCDTEDELYDKFIQIPPKLDILITHSPAYCVLDGVPIQDGSLYHCGSKSLYAYLKYVERPRAHICGHIHEAYGQEEHFPTYLDNMMQSINCSHVNGQYEPVNAPIRLIL
jgi:Icc-related predicted phosphoesterase